MNLEASRIPLLASPQGGVAEQPIKCCEASAERSAGVVFRLKRKENHPVCVRLRRLRVLLMGAATPPCCGARGVALDSDLFTPSMTARSSHINEHGRS